MQVGIQQPALVASVRLLLPSFFRVEPKYCGILVLLADASMLDERAPPRQGVLISWMLRLFIHLLFAGPSRQSTRDGSMSLWRYSDVGRARNVWGADAH